MMLRIVYVLFLVAQILVITTAISCAIGLCQAQTALFQAQSELIAKQPAIRTVVIPKVEVLGMEIAVRGRPGKFLGIEQ